jgi:hypothetical protein
VVWEGIANVKIDILINKGKQRKTDMSIVVVFFNDDETGSNIICIFIKSMRGVQYLTKYKQNPLRDQTFVIVTDG